jgi:hypothetical protein
MMEGFAPPAGVEFTSGEDGSKEKGKNSERQTAGRITTNEKAGGASFIPLPFV